MAGIRGDSAERAPRMGHVALVSGIYVYIRNRAAYDIRARGLYHRGGEPGLEAARRGAEAGCWAAAEERTDGAAPPTRV